MVEGVRGQATPVQLLEIKKVLDALDLGGSDASPPREGSEVGEAGSEVDGDSEMSGELVVYDATVAALQLQPLVCGWGVKKEGEGEVMGSAFIWELKPKSERPDDIVEPSTVENPLSTQEAMDLDSARQCPHLPAGHQQIAQGAKAKTPKGKAKAKAKAKGQSKGKKGPKKPSPADPRSSARKLAYSQAYHKAKWLALQAGRTEEEAKEQGRIAGRAAADGE